MISIPELDQRMAEHQARAVGADRTGWLRPAARAGRERRMLDAPGNRAGEPRAGDGGRRRGGPVAPGRNVG